MFKKNCHLLNLIIFASPMALAGSLEPPAGSTESASAMYNIQDLCARLESGATASKQTFTEPTGVPVDSSRCTLNDLMDKSPAADDTQGATPAEVLAGKTFWGLNSGHWGPQTGTLTTQTPNNTTVNQPAGNYAAFDLSTVDTDLTSGNIKSGIILFGVPGDSNIVDTSSGDALSAEILSGKKAWVDGSEITGTLTTQTPTHTTVNQPAGNYLAFDLSSVDTDLASGNLKSGITLFGVSGHSNVVDTSSGDATAANILTGKKAWVDGNEITGTVSAGNNVTGGDGQITFTIPDGLYSGNTATAHDTDLTAANVKNGVDIFGVIGTDTGVGGHIQDTSSGDALAADIVSGKKAWVDGNEVTGTLPTQSLSDANTTVNAGYYEATTLEAVDADLTASNIKSGVTLFGIDGTYTGGSSVAVVKTGQTTSSATGDDGDLETGATWPNPRFTDNSNGTVTDNLTNLIWLKNANCFGLRTWTDALSDANSLANGSCSLTDSSSAGDWRLPNVNELQSLIAWQYSSPALSNAVGTAQWTEGNAFSGVQTYYYWSSTAHANNASYAWYVGLSSGYVGNYGKTNSNYVWPVRGGQ
jgi:hypothetical protein